MIRAATSSDILAIRAVETAAFGQVDEADLVDRLRADGDVLAELVADGGGQVQGHILFSHLRIGDLACAALAPLAVVPDAQGQGIGSALCRAGIDACRALGLPVVVVLGNPDYYGRFGFSAAAATGLLAPFNGPHFMALELMTGGVNPGAVVRYAAAFGLG